MLKPHKNAERGAAIIELALSMVVFLMVIFGIIDMGRALYAYDYVSDAARRGTRFAMVRGTHCSSFPTACPASLNDVQSYLQNYPGIDASALSVTGSCIIPTKASGEPLPCAPGLSVQLTVQYQYTSIIPFIKPLSWTMTSYARMLVTQ